MPPPLVAGKTEAEYRDLFLGTYCRAVVKTFDGIRVFFRPDHFDHAFFESVNRRAKDKSRFSNRRAERILWIKAALEDPDAEIYVGWDRDKKVEDPDSRVTVVFEDHVVVIKLKKKRPTEAIFITAYPADEESLAKIRSHPQWPTEEKKEAAG